MENGGKVEHNPVNELISNGGFSRWLAYPGFDILFLVKSSVEGELHVVTGSFFFFSKAFLPMDQ